MSILIILCAVFLWGSLILAISWSFARVIRENFFGKKEPQIFPTKKKGPHDLAMTGLVAQIELDLYKSTLEKIPNKKKRHSKKKK